MEPRNFLFRSGLIALCLLFVGGLVQLNRAGFNRSYPPFSSLRSDPEGTKLLWEGLARTGKVSETRNYRPFEEAHFAHSAIFYLGLRPASVAYADESFFRQAEEAAKDGNRLILGLTDDLIQRDEKSQSKSLAWKFWKVRFIPVFEPEGKHSAAVTVKAYAPWQLLPGEVWERKFGAGSIVLLPHVSRISNAALAKDGELRQLIPVLIGSHRAVVFDESHFGIVESGSIAGLARKYRLQGLLAGLLILTALFLWNRSIAFPPVQEGEEDERTRPIKTNGTRGMLADLLSRHIPPQDLLAICIAEWNRVKPDGKITEDQNRTDEDPVAVYRTIQESLKHEKTWKL